MSVLIKGMEMPSETILFQMRANGDVYKCNALGVDRYIGKAIEIPPHGRLIDADKLTELCDIMADKCDGIGESIWGQFRATVEWSPTIIEAEE